MEVIRSGWLTMGQTTEEFERRFAEAVGVRHALAVTNGTAALHLAGLAVGLGPGEEVICPSLSFVAGANSILYTGAEPVFADVTSLNDLTISPADIAAKITPRTKAVQVMHYAGQPCDMEPIMDLARAHHLAVIEDCAHAPGAALNGRHCGALGQIGCFSFFSNKNMTTGEGGMVTTDDDQLAAKIRLMRSHGMTTLTLERHRGHAFSYDVVALGYNFRLDEIRAAIGLAQLDKLALFNARRSLLAEHYCQRLSEIDGLAAPFGFGRGLSINHIMPVILDQDLDRAAFMRFMKQKGVQTSIHYPPIHLFEFYKRRLNGQRPFLPLTEAAGRREVTLPLYPSMDEGDVEFVCQAIEEFMYQARSRA